MSDPLAKTFSLLAATANPQAVDLLLLALDGRDSAIREHAAVALLKRNSTRGHLEVIRRLNSLPPPVFVQIEKSAPQLAPAVRQGLLHGDSELRRNALDLIRSTQSFDQFGTLLDLLNHDDAGLQDPAADAIRELVNALLGQSRNTDAEGGRKPLRDAVQIRQRILLQLDQACSRFPELKRPEIVVESILMLGDPEHGAVRNALGHQNTACRELTHQLLVTSQHPAVMQLLLGFLSKNYPPPKILETIQSRDDLEFVCHLLRWLPARLGQTQQRNIKQITTLTWLGQPRFLEMLPVALHQPLVEFVAATGLTSDEKLNLQQWLLRNGTPQGRLAAAHALASLDQQAVQEIVFEGLDSDDAEVQAWAVSQLRVQKVPEALALLIGRLDSPLEAVREAARAELSSFNLERVLNVFEQLDSQVCLNAGRLIEKVDPNCVAKLAAELASPIRKRRMRAARGAKALGVHQKLAPALIRMLGDTEPLVRRTVLEVLAGVPTQESIEAVQRHLDDESPRVREAAVRALAQLQGGAAPLPTAGAS